MKITLDGGKTWLDSEKGEWNPDDMEVVVDLLPEEMQERRIHIKTTSEGVIMDVWERDDDAFSDDECTGTSAQMYDEIFDRLAPDDGPSQPENSTIHNEG